MGGGAHILGLDGWKGKIWWVDWMNFLHLPLGMMMKIHTIKGSRDLLGYKSINYYRLFFGD